MINEIKTILCKCEKCGYVWTPSYRGNIDNLNIPPIICPGCKSPYWNRKN